ncbi:hypothetical protein DID75_03060 [Candidatus Marinamargulisbacteria bacterium SCGC AG-410-N11]|nr:hypothetical protein DID75_03060 [Candidatus Marinamargulisbacteria bacterium SCGC AG-410-N11]
MKKLLSISKKSEPSSFIDQNIQELISKINSIIIKNNLPNNIGFANRLLNIKLFKSFNKMIKTSLKEYRKLFDFKNSHSDVIETMLRKQLTSIYKYKYHVNLDFESKKLESFSDIASYYTLRNYLEFEKNAKQYICKPIWDHLNVNVKIEKTRHGSLFTINLSDLNDVKQVSQKLVSIYVIHALVHDITSSSSFSAKSFLKEFKDTLNKLPLDSSSNNLEILSCNVQEMKSLNRFFQTISSFKSLLPLLFNAFQNTGANINQGLRYFTENHSGQYLDVMEKPFKLIIEEACKLTNSTDKFSQHLNHLRSQLSLPLLHAINMSLTSKSLANLLNHLFFALSLKDFTGRQKVVSRNSNRYYTNLNKEHLESLVFELEKLGQVFNFNRQLSACFSSVKLDHSYIDDFYKTIFDKPELLIDLSQPKQSMDSFNLYDNIQESMDVVLRTQFFDHFFKGCNDELKQFMLRKYKDGGLSISYGDFDHPCDFYQIKFLFKDALVSDVTKIESFQNSFNFHILDQNLSSFSIAFNVRFLTQKQFLSKGKLDDSVLRRQFTLTKEFLSIKSKIQNHLSQFVTHPHKTPNAFISNQKSVSDTELDRFYNYQSESKESDLSKLLKKIDRIIKKWQTSGKALYPDSNSVYDVVYKLLLKLKQGATDYHGSSSGYYSFDNYTQSFKKLESAVFHLIQSPATEDARLIILSIDPEGCGKGLITKTQRLLDVVNQCDDISLILSSLKSQLVTSLNSGAENSMFVQNFCHTYCYQLGFSSSGLNPMYSFSDSDHNHYNTFVKKYNSLTIFNKLLSSFEGMLSKTTMSSSSGASKFNHSFEDQNFEGIERFLKRYFETVINKDIFLLKLSTGTYFDTHMIKFFLPILVFKLMLKRELIYFNDAA